MEWTKQNLKECFLEVLGALSVSEIIQNKEMMKQIKILETLLTN